MERSRVAWGSVGSLVAIGAIMWCASCACKRAPFLDSTEDPPVPVPEHAQPSSTPVATLGGAPIAASAIIADHRAVASFDRIPKSFVEAAKGKFRLWYGHTSHGSQIVTGIKMVAASNGVYHTPGTFLVERDGEDLGQNGDRAWADSTLGVLNQPGNDRNVVMWSWCGGVTGNTVAGIRAYLDTMSGLETRYPKVRFVYMTGHTDAGAVQQTRARNKQIRDYCLANRKVLFDFEDIESWDAKGKFHPNTGDDCAWCSNHCRSNACPTCDDCAHSHCYNCYVKGKAFWWMMARLAGWNGG